MFVEKLSRNYQKYSEIILEKLTNFAKILENFEKIAPKLLSNFKKIF